MLDEYRYDSGEATSAHAVLLPALLQLLEGLEVPEKRIFDLGCGNGFIANELHKRGWDVTGVDVSRSGIAQARKNYPDINFHEGSAYENLAEKHGTFPVVISLEVVEHLYFPRKFANTVFSLLEKGGHAIISTPFHGYWKNLALALTGKMDAHFTALWDHGHIKFWSERTLRILLEEAGFSSIEFHRVGRIPPLAKSMMAICRKS